jgi:hypothetical protein
MRQQIRLSEADLHRIIRNCVNEAIEDENWFKNMGRGIKGAFGGDVEKVGDAISKGARNVGSAIASGARSVKQGAQNFGRGVSDRYKAAKEGFETGQNNDMLNSVIKQMQNLIMQGVISMDSGNQVIRELTSKLKE